MDVFCKFCGEPWDNDELHELVDDTDNLAYATYDQAEAAFRKAGCEIFTGRQCLPDPSAADIADIYDLLGDGLDGASTYIEDHLTAMIDTEEQLRLDAEDDERTLRRLGLLT